MFVFMPCCHGTVPILVRYVAGFRIVFTIWFACTAPVVFEFFLLAGILGGSCLFLFTLDTIICDSNFGTAICSVWFISCGIPAVDSLFLVLAVPFV